MDLDNVFLYLLDLWQWQLSWNFKIVSNFKTFKTLSILDVNCKAKIQSYELVKIMMNLTILWCKVQS